MTILAKMCIVFFKHKTAYYMRISDWSSDVCSADLRHRGIHRSRTLRIVARHGAQHDGAVAHRARHRPRLVERGGEGDDAPARAAAVGRLDARSEEHTSELQSLMRISYAVFCLKKKQST